MRDRQRRGATNTIILPPRDLSVKSKCSVTYSQNKTVKGKNELQYRFQLCPKVHRFAAEQREHFLLTWTTYSHTHTHIPEARILRVREAIFL
jgi:hypothetical protein